MSPGSAASKSDSIRSPAHLPSVGMAAKRLKEKTPKTQADHPKDDVDPYATNMNVKYYGNLLAAYNVVLNCPELQNIIQEEPIECTCMFLEHLFASCLHVHVISQPTSDNATRNLCIDWLGQCSS